MKIKMVSSLTDKELEDLNHLVNEDASARVRMRAEAILLSAKGFSIKQISKIKGKHIITVSRWLDQWEESGVDGLLEREGRGRPKILTEDEQREVAKWLSEDKPPRSAAALAVKIEKVFGKKLSKDTVKRLLKACGKVWKRVRCSLAGDRDEENFRQCEQELAEHLQASGRGDIRLLYMDQSGFNGVSYIPYAWQDKGVTLEIPCCRGKRINVLGILSVSDAKLEVFMPEGTVTSQVILDTLDKIAETAKSATVPTVLVLDNASIHTARIVRNKRLEWEEKSLFLYFLPTYSPELNLIEILWHKIKYEWLPFDAHESYEKLRSYLDSIFSGFGREYNIEFA